MTSELLFVAKLRFCHNFFESHFHTESFVAHAINMNPPNIQRRIRDDSDMSIIVDTNHGGGAATLNNRITTLEGEAATRNARITDLENDLAASRADVGQLTLENACLGRVIERMHAQRVVRKRIHDTMVAKMKKRSEGVIDNLLLRIVQLRGVDPDEDMSE